MYVQVLTALCKSRNGHLVQAYHLINTLQVHSSGVSQLLFQYFYLFHYLCVLHYQSSVSELRSQCADYIRSHADGFLPYLTDPDTGDQFSEGIN